MARPVARILALQVTFSLGLLLVVGRAGYLQLIKGGEYQRKADRQRTVSVALPARRGTIYDRNGIPLAVSQPKYRVTLALNEVTDTALLVKRASARLRIRADSLRRSFRRGTPRYPYFHGPWSDGEIGPLRGMKGVHLETVYSRGYPNNDLARPIVGAVGGEQGSGVSGIERTLDSLLSGVAGLTVQLKDPSGRRFESPSRLVREPVPGHDVYLTIDAGLQEIAENALAKSIAEFRAEGGDVVFYDPRSGELLALASLGAQGPAITSTAFTSPFEPGSTAKPFTAAALLTLGRVRPEQTVSGEDGAWTFPTRGRASRKITDTHPQRIPMTLAHVIQVSSNIGIAKFSRELRWEEQYDMLRAFGFGAPTGAEYPSEAAGKLVRPDRWLNGYDSESLAMGYTLEVTAVQLAAAYGTFANEGALLAPTLVREIRNAGGEMLYRSAPERVRQVLTPEIAATLRGFLLEAASDSGTGSQGQVRGGILGKTGTAQLLRNGRYQGGGYRASFAALYPAGKPQIVAVTTIVRPQGAYYGGLTAAPLTASMLSQALSSRESVLDRSVVAEARLTSRAEGAGTGDREPEFPSRAVRLPLPAASGTAPRLVTVPDLTGRAIRGAVFALHKQGLRARLSGGGPLVVKSVPAPGDSLAPGKTVLLVTGPSNLQ